MSVYLDHNATTPLDGRVLEAMMPYLRGEYGNPSSVHRFGRMARAAIDTAREQVAQLAGAHPTQVIFTSGGTEANNLAVKGVAGGSAPGKIAVSAMEHASVLGPARAVARCGWGLSEIAVDSQGRVTKEAVSAALDTQTRLVSVMAANNETGAIQDIAAISDAARAAGSVMHTDAVQAAGKLALDFGASGAHLMSLSAHKLYGPKGVGALLVDKALELAPLLDGGGQERGRRGGTENVAAIVGFGAAAELAVKDLDARCARQRSLRGRLEDGVRALRGAVIFAEQAQRLPNTVYFAVPGIDGETLMLNLDTTGIAVSSGSACSSESSGPSHVLTAMGVAADLARCAIRVSFGEQNTAADVDALLAALRTQCEGLAKLALGAWA